MPSSKSSTPQLEIVYQDESIVAINKPAGLASIPGRSETDSAIQQLGRQLSLPTSGEADPRIRVVHRLDKDTSGILLFAKNLAAQRHLSHQFQNNSVRKEYLALVIGRPPTEEGEIDAPIEPDRQRVGAMKVDRRGKPARTATSSANGRVDTTRSNALCFASLEMSRRSLSAAISLPSAPLRMRRPRRASACRRNSVGTECST